MCQAGDRSRAEPSVGATIMNEYAQWLERLASDRLATSHGVLFISEESAIRYADHRDMEVIEVDGPPHCWLAKTRSEQLTAMPTKTGDVVIQHLRQLYRVWVVTFEGAQQPDPHVAPLEKWSRDTAETAAREWAESTNGKILLLRSNGWWAILSE